MTYDELVTSLAHRTGLHSDIVKKVLTYFPEALMDLPVGGDVRTPMGVFRKTQRNGRTITLPDGTTTAEVAPKAIVRLRPGAKLKSEG